MLEMVALNWEGPPEDRAGPSFEQRRQQVDAAPIQGSQHCHAHGRMCSLQPVDIDISGLPCEDNSKINVKRQFQHGRFGNCYLAWTRYHREAGTPLLILENTPEPRLAATLGCSDSSKCVS